MVVFTLGGEYTAPSGNSADFLLICERDPTTQRPFISGTIHFDGIESEGLAYIFVLADGVGGFDPILCDGAISIPPAVFGECEFDVIDAAGDAILGARVMGSLFQLGTIDGNGGFEILPFVLSSELSFEREIEIEGGVAVGPITTPTSMEFSSGIDFVRGRVVFGHPEAPIFRQLYELSNDRRVEILTYPEECEYPIFLGDTHVDINDTPVRAGSIRFSLLFNHDARDIDEIHVWVKNKDGHAFRDTSKIIDHPGGSYTDHILTDPFKHSYSLTIPVHCVTDYDNEMFLEIVYRQDDMDVRVMAEHERYFIPFQPHFDDLRAFANLADQFSSNTAKSGATFVSATADSFERIYVTESESFVPQIVGGMKMELSSVFDELSKQILIEYDWVNISTLGISGTHSFNFVSDELGSGTIGG